jgi:hypothetical protein
MKAHEHRKLEEHKTSLTPAEQLRVAVAVIVDGIDQHKVAALMGVNPGRVANAVTTARKAFNIPEDAQGQLKLVDPLSQANSTNQS